MADFLSPNCKCQFSEASLTSLLKLHPFSPLFWLTYAVFFSLFSPPPPLFSFAVLENELRGALLLSCSSHLSIISGRSCSGFGLELGVLLLQSQVDGAVDVCHCADQDSLSLISH